MPQFEDDQKRLNEARAAQAGAGDELARARQRLDRVERQLRLLARSDPDGDAARALAEEQRVLEARIKALGATLVRAKEQLADAFTRFDTWADPRRNLAAFNDDIPIMLFPLRMETRFKTVNEQGASRSQLWVRVFPDECLVDTFDPGLTESEVANATRFWREYVHAAGVESAERAAWRTLVAAHGSGRATWIVRQYRPRNPLKTGDPQGDPALEVPPQALGAGEVLLVAAYEGMLPEPERAALAVFWAALWRAGSGVAAQQAAVDALAAAVGAARAEELRAKVSPYNLAEAAPAGFTRDSATVRVFLLALPAAADSAERARSWSRAATAALLPERLVLLGYQGAAEVLNVLGEPIVTPLHVSPDPRLDPESQFQFDADGNLTLGEELRWMVDFDEAVKRGMGFRVTLNDTQTSGFDRLFVLGVRMSGDAARGAADLQELFLHHHHGKSGFALLPQGSPTNNTEEGSSAHARTDDPEASFDVVFKEQARFEEVEDWLDKRDGQWFAEALGLDSEWLKQIPNAGATDQLEARAMNTALWPATLGYFMDTLMKPVFDDDAQYYTRWFFNRFVSGRGPVPAIRIGRQPYGILPATAYSRVSWTDTFARAPHARFALRYLEERPTAFQGWLARFKSVLDALRVRWQGIAAGIEQVGPQAKDPHQTLLDVLGLHPGSVEFHQRYAATREQEHNLAALWQMFIAWPSLPANQLHNEAFELLNDLGYGGLETPPLFDLFWKVFPNALTGPAIQAGPLSETDPLMVVTTDNRNYIQWLAAWARVSFDTIRVQDGFQGGQWPNALLFILLRHALQLGYHDAGWRVLDDAALLGDEQKAVLRTEPHFFHVQEAVSSTGPAATPSRYQMLYTPYPSLTGDARVPLAEFLGPRIGALFGTRYLSEQLRALDRLAPAPTARLERLMAEHLDCCTYRLDAWLTGLVHFQLASMRHARSQDSAGSDQEETHRKGIYLGAYGWLENVRPVEKTLTPVRLQGELDEIFNVRTPGRVPQPPLMRDSANQGYIHAPSVNHAVTAAVLRNGYVANATPEQPDLLKVNLSSERVRRALMIIEGIRGGQSLAALLGYEFERGLHDRYAVAEVDRFIYPLRGVFPLATTAPEELPEGTPIQAVEARNVVNGLALLRHVRTPPAANRTYPFGFPATRLPHDATAAQRQAIDAEVDRLLDLHDALADLAVAEGVHQVVMGNYDRAAATLDAYGQATFPPIPEVVQTPRSGIALTHRVGLQFDATVAALAADNPRVRAEPAMNDWVARLLPAPARIGCKVRYLEPGGTERFTFVTLAQLGLQPLDLVYVLDPDNLPSAATPATRDSADAAPGARAELDDRVRDFVLRQGALAVRPDLLREIAWYEGNPGDFSFVDVASMVRSLRALLLHSRPLRATDVALPTEARVDAAGAAAIARTRVDFLPGELTGERDTRLAALLAELDAALPETGPVLAAIVANLDGWFDRLLAVCRALAGYGMGQTGLGSLLEARATLIRRILAKAAAVAARWQRLRDQFNHLVGVELPALADEEARIALLLRAERLISTSALDATGLSSAQLQAALQPKVLAFQNRHDALLAIAGTGATTVAGVLAALQALLPLTAFEVEQTLLTEEEGQLVVAAQDLRARVAQLIEGIGKRIDALNARLGEHDAEADPEQRIRLLTEAARLVLGEQFVLAPTFGMGAQQGAEWTQAYAARASLLDYQRDVRANPFAVDDWLYAMARVSPKLHEVENLVLVAEALGGSAPLLEPLQFPFAAGAPWMALEFPPEARSRLENELLLYTACFARPFASSEPQCGLLLEEWTEVVPAETETTGIAFQFDKPNAEPPQSILLATPPQFAGAWRWDDLVRTLHETLDMARLRAVEPQQLDQTALSVFLPATILATTWRPVTIAADLSFVNNLANRVP